MVLPAVWHSWGVLCGLTHGMTQPRYAVWPHPWYDTAKVCCVASPMVWHGRGVLCLTPVVSWFLLVHFFVVSFSRLSWLPISLKCRLNMCILYCTVVAFKWCWSWHLQKCVGCTQIHCARCLVVRSGCFSGRPACAKCLSLAMGDYTHDYLARQFTVRELRQFLSTRCVPIDSCTEKHDLIELVMRLRRSSAVRAEEEEHSRHVSQLKVITDYSTACLFADVFIPLHPLVVSLRRSRT